MRLLAFLLAALPMWSAAQTVYRCEMGGKIADSDAPCISGRVIDATPTQGMDKMAGKSRKGKEVQREEFTREVDKALLPLHGRSHAEMNVMRRRVYLPSKDQLQCNRLDHEISDLIAGSARSDGAGKARADVELYKARKLAFDLKC